MKSKHFWSHRTHPVSYTQSSAGRGLSLSKMANREVEEEGLNKEAVEEEEDDEHGSKERVLQKYFLMEWELVKSLLNDIVSHGRVSDPSSVYKIRSIVSSFTSFPMFLILLSLINWWWIYIVVCSEFTCSVKWWWHCGIAFSGENESKNFPRLSGPRVMGKFKGCTNSFVLEEDL